MRVAVEKLWRVVYESGWDDCLVLLLEDGSRLVRHRKQRQWRVKRQIDGGLPEAISRSPLQGQTMSSHT